MFDKRVIIIIIISALLSITISHRFSDQSKELYKQVFVYKVWTRKKYDLIIAGDSRIYRGVSTRPFEDELNIRAINLGFSSGQFETRMFELVDEKLNFGSNDKSIVLGITPHSLTRASVPNGHIKRIKGYSDEEVMEYLYMLEFKKHFSSINFLELYRKIAYQKQVNYITEPKKSEGWIASDYLNRQPYSAIKSYRKIFKNKTIDEKILNDLLFQVKKWYDSGIKVYGFLPPSSPNIETIERIYSGFSDSMIIRKFIENGGRWILLDNIYESYDGSHLTKDAAIEMSNEMVNKIKEGNYLEEFDSSLNYRPQYFSFNNIMYNDSSVHSIEKEKNIHQLLRIDSDDIVNNSIKKIYVNLDVLNNEAGEKLFLVCNIIRNGNNILYKTLNISQIIKEGTWTPVFYHMDIPDDILPTDVVKFYIHNVGENKLQIKNISFYSLTM